MKHEIRQALAMIATALGVAACGGGGGGDSFAGIDRLGVSSGTITGFGSIFVNGVEWETSGASIDFDDGPGSESDLAIGQVVTVRGTLDVSGRSGTADAVEFDNEVEGPVASIDAAAGSFVVLGQVVLTSADTTFDDGIAGGLAGLQVGDRVEVSGYRDAAGAIRASRIERQSPADEAEVKGMVSGLDPGASTFLIGSLLVDYAGAVLEDFGSEALGNGDFVEAKGSLAGGVLVAGVVEREDGLSGEDGEDSEVEGFVTRFVSAADFDVAGVRVTTGAGTEFSGGTSADLALDIKVEVEGEFNASGVLVADEVEIRVQPEDIDVEIHGLLTSAPDLQAGTFRIEGVLVRVSPTTLYEDSSSADLDAFSIADLNTGDYVEVRGAEDGSAAGNDVLATRIKRDEPDDARLRGPIQAENEPDLTVLGITIGTAGAVFRDADDNPLSAAAFFLAVSPGDVIEAQTDQLDDFSGTQFDAGEVEIEEFD